MPVDRPPVFPDVSQANAGEGNGELRGISGQFLEIGPCSRAEVFQIVRPDEDSLFENLKEGGLP